MAVVYLTRALVDSLTAALSGPQAGISALRGPMLLAALFVAVVLAGELLQAVTRWVRTTQSDLVRDHVAGLVQERAVSLDLGHYESPDYFDALFRVISDTGQRPAAVVENLGVMLQNIVTLLAMAAVLTRFGVWIPLALVISTLPGLVVVLRYALREHDWRLRNTEDERRASYYQWLMTWRDTAAEMRLFGLGRHLRKRFEEVRARLRSERSALARDQGIAELTASGAAYLVAGLALAFMVWRTVQKQVTLGDLAMFYQAFNQGQRLLRTLLSNAGEVYSSSLFLSNLFEFLELEPTVVDPPPERRRPFTLQKGIQFREVSFHYPHSVRAALERFDLEVPAGAVTAVVGANGAGKSTLLKLLCRFYDPQKGAVEVDGVDLRDVALDELRHNVAVLFQEPVHYNATVRENVGYGDLARAEDAGAVELALRDAAADEVVARLPQGLGTRLGSWFTGGEEISVGEWQRVALARAFLRDAPLVLLDEPTSAMDSWAENDWMARFRTLAAGRTALVITHRFTTAMRADVIHVMQAGRIVESGTHEALLAADGLYAASWREQVAAQPR